MKTRNLFAWSLTVILLATAPAALAQRKGKAKRATAEPTAEAVEPLRVINGQLSGHTVAGEINTGGHTGRFTFTFTRTEIVGGRLQLSGAFSVDNQLSQVLAARLVGVMVKATNPWPSAREELPKDKSKSQATDHKGKEKSKPPATEQTQSLYVQGDAATDCGLLFLRMELPPRLRSAMGAGSEPVQMGIVLAPIDNRKGEEINHGICQVYKILSNKAAGGNLVASLDALNRLLAASR
jgi:hypothetical protein